MGEGKGMICAEIACQPVEMKEKVTKSVREMWGNRKDV